MAKNQEEILRSEAYYKRQDELLSSFHKEFPDAWCKPGSEFSSNSQEAGRLLWSGEGSYCLHDQGGYLIPIFTPNAPGEMALAIRLQRWSEREGVRWEPYDDGTWFAYDDKE